MTEGSAYSREVRTMRKRILCLLMMLVLLMGPTLTVNAEHYYGADNWAVYFDGDKMISNFTDAEMSETVREIQPGDDVLFQVHLKNQHTGGTDWYMTNEVISTLEESVNVAEGGAYSYLLKYTDADGKEIVLYDSEVVGGEEDTALEGEGLHQATNALEEYYYLDRLNAGETGLVTLFVALEGETQGNDYQDTLAQLKMNFAVELVKTPTGNITGTTTAKNPATVIPTIVKTGDESPILLFSGLALASGLVLLFVALGMMKKRGGEKGDLQ